MLRFKSLEIEFFKQMDLRFFLLLFLVTSIFASMKGIVFLNEEEDLLAHEELMEVEGLFAKEIFIPDRLNLEEKMAKYFKTPITFDLVSELKKEVLLYFQRENPLVQVLVPPQNITAGVLQMCILKAKLGRLEVQSNRLESASYLKKNIGLNPGQEIDAQQIERRLQFFNRNPFRQIDLIYQPGAQAQTTDITLLVQDHKPYRISTGAESSDSSVRYYAGISVAKELGWSHVFSGQFSTSLEQNKAFNMSYLGFFPWGHFMNLFGGHSDFYLERENGLFVNRSSGFQTSFRYTIPLTIGEWFFGLDCKRNKSVSEFNLQQIKPLEAANITQLMFGYGGQYRGLEWNTEIFWFPKQVQGWVYARSLVRYLHRLSSKFAFFMEMRGQIASQSLMPSEQIGLGGVDSIRGYRERTFSADHAILSKLEIRFPSFSIIRRKTFDDLMEWLFFIDGGFGWKKDLLFSSGLGVRYFIGTWLAMHIDYGFQLSRLPALFEQEIGKLHFHFSAHY